MLGLKRKIVRLVPYNPRWKDAFIREKRRIKKALARKAKGIEHIGSTAIPGVWAKPIMDIQVGIDNIQNYRACAGPLHRLGYVFRGSSFAGERLFVKGPESKRTHYLHMTRKGSRYWVLHLRFRDYLRRNREAAGEYSGLKKRLFRRFKSNRKRYTDGKGKFVRSILRKARSDRQ